MAKVNIVTAGDYKGDIQFLASKESFCIYPPSLFSKKTYINKETVDHYEVIGEESSTSFGSGVVRGAVGAAAFGVVGAVAGAASAKKKGVHTVSIVFKDGTKCLCELDDKNFKHLIEIMY